MTNEERQRQIAYEKWVGAQGNNSMGTMANQQGYETYLKKQAQQKAYWEACTPTASPINPTYPSFDTRPSSPAPQNTYSGTGSTYGSPGSYTPTWVDEFVDSIRSTLLWGFLGLLGLGGIAALYEKIGLEGFILIGLYLGLGGLLCLSVWLLYRGMRWFFKTRIGRVVTTILCYTAYAGLAALAVAILLWVVSTSHQ